MAEIRFYHLQRTPLERALPDLLQRALAKGMRSVVLGEPDRLARLDRLLWSFDDDSFLPHGFGGPDRKGEEGAEDQPIWLTDRAENPNGASALFLVDGAEAAADGFSLVCDLFDGEDSEALERARGRYARARQSGATLTYWRQGEGGWEKAG